MLSESCASDDGGHPDWGWTEHGFLDRRGFERFVPEAQSLLLSHGRFDIPFTRPLATTLLAIALPVMVLPAIGPPSGASSARSGRRRAPGP